MLRSNDLTNQPILQPRTRGIARPLRVRVVAAEELSQDAIDRWGEIQDADPALASPYFSPDFTLRVADVWPDIRVAILETGDRQVGFFPFQARGRSGHAVGERLNHREGAIVERGIDVHPVELIRLCGLRDWRFNMMPASQEAFAPFHQSHWQAPYMDLSAGYEAYVADHKRRHSGKWFATLGRLQRKLEREVGPLRFMFHSEEPRDFETIIRLKTEQFQHYNNLNDPAYMALFRHLLATPTPRCSVGVSVLHVGDRFIAGQIAVGSQSMLGPVVTSYDPALARYSPGSLLMIKACEEAAARGIVTYDLSGGEQAYKSIWMSDADELAGGYVATDRLTAAQRSIEAAYQRRKYHLLNHGALGPERRLGRAVRDIRGRMPTRSST